MSFDLLKKLLAWLRKLLSQKDRTREPPSKAPFEAQPPETDQSSPPGIPEPPPDTGSLITPPELSEENGSKISENNHKPIESEKQSDTEVNKEARKDNEKDKNQSDKDDSFIDTDTLKKTRTQTVEKEIEKDTRITGVDEPEKAKTQVEKKKIAKPYIKKSPMEIPEEHKGVTENKNKTEKVKPNEIDLGGSQKKTERQIKARNRRPTKKQNRKKQINIPLTRVMSPFVALNLSEAKVFLVLPAQEFNQEEGDTSPKTIEYKLVLNKKERTVPVKTSKQKNNLLRTEEKKVEIDRPLESFRIDFPNELENRTYTYNHPENIPYYAFVDTSNDCARMHYLCDGEGFFNDLPKRHVWILMKENFSVINNVDVIKEVWIWENYQQPFRINLKEANEIIIRENETNIEKIIPCHTYFWIEGDGLVEDDFTAQSPIFTSDKIRLYSAKKEIDGWTAWLQHRFSGYLVFEKNWTGENCLEVEVPGQLPCDCGEFQIDICKTGEHLPTDTLFFRHIPGLRLEYNQNLSLPDYNQGHRTATVEIILKDDFQLRTKNKIKKTKDCNDIKIPPADDVVNLCISKKDNPGNVVKIRITLKRVRWKIDEQSSWADRPLLISKDELVTGVERYLEINTNDAYGKYDILAVLESKEKIIQEEKFAGTGAIYKLWLNKFYETIKNSGEVNLKAEFREKSGQEIGKIKIIHFGEAEKKQQAEMPYQKAKVKGAKGMRVGRGFSLQEVREAGIDVNMLRCLHIPLDRRRKTTYSQNIETIKSLY